MDIKYTKDGKKVSVVGKINSTQWIVQEVYVSGGNEFPAGESFVVTSLLDAPAETYQSKELKRQEQRLKESEAEIKKIDAKINKLKVYERGADILNKIIETYGTIDVSQIETFLDFISGKITHVVRENYSGYTIETLLEAVTRKDSYGYSGGVYFDGLRLVSLFGCPKELYDKDKTSYRLDWRLCQYYDGIGSKETIYPFKSFESAREFVRNKIYFNLEANSALEEEKHHLHRTQIESANKYDIRVDDKYINQLRNYDRRTIEASIKKQEEELLKKKEELNKLV